MILISWFLDKSWAAIKVLSGFDFVSLSIISKRSLSMEFSANLTELTIDLPMSEYSPVNGASSPILILSFENTTWLKKR